MLVHFIYSILVSVSLFSQILGSNYDLTTNSQLAKLGWQPDFVERLVQTSSTSTDESLSVTSDDAIPPYRLIELPSESHVTLPGHEIKDTPIAEKPVYVVDTADNSTSSSNITTPDGKTKGADISFRGMAYGCGIHRDCLSCQNYENEGCYWTSESGCFQLPRGVLKKSQCSGKVEVGEIKATCENYPTCSSCTMQSGCVYYKGQCTYSSGPSCRLDIFNCANAPEDCPISNKVLYRPQPNPKLQQIINDPYSSISFPSTPIPFHPLPIISPHLPLSPLSIPYSYPIRYKSASTLPFPSHRVEYIREPQTSHHIEYSSTPVTLNRPFPITSTSYLPKTSPTSISRTTVTRPTLSHTYRNVEVNPTYLTYKWP